MFLFSVKKTKENGIDMLLLAQDMEAEEARQQCCDVLNKMTLNELENLEDFSELNGPSMQALLVPMVKRLLECMKKMLPEFLGSLDGMMYLWKNEKNPIKMRGVPNMCQIHQISEFTELWRTRRLLNVDKMYERIKCDECKAMFKQMARNGTSYISPSGTYLSENSVNVLEEMMKLIKEH